MPYAYISFGSNINPAENVLQSFRLLAQQVRILDISTVYLTTAIDRPEQPRYYNGVMVIETQQSPLDLKYNILRAIETQLVRERTEDKSAPRPIDLDILIYDDMVIDNPQLILPDPKILQRPFIALPLYELTPELLIPKYNIPIKDIAVAMDTSNMHPLEEYTLRLRKEILTHDKKEY